MTRKTIKILIVDDLPANLMALNTTLKDLDVEVVQAQSGEEALRAALYNDFALAILDVHMPEMDGFELAELLRANPSTTQLPIIFLSAVYSSDFHIFRGYELGAVDYLVKPYEPSFLLAKVRVFIQLSQQRAELLAIKNELDQRVVRRTTELQNANTKMSALISAFGELVYEQEDLNQPVAWKGNINIGLGYDQDELPNDFEGWCALVHPDDLNKVTLARHNARDNEGMYALTYRVKDTQGHYQWVRDVGRVVRSDKTGKVSGVLGVLKNVDEEQRREVEKNLMVSALSNMSDGLVLTNVSGEVVATNPAYCRLTGLASESLLGSNFRKTHPFTRNDPDAKSLWAFLRRDSRWSGEAQVLDKDEKWLPVWINAFVVRDEQGGIEHYAFLVADLSSLEATKEQIHYLAFYDTLTELPNRAMFRETVNAHLASSQRSHRKHGLLFVDLDRFKVVNDTLGHTAGDEMLRFFSRELKQCVRNSDVVARQSGDEFAIFLTDITSAHDIDEVGEKIIHHFTENYFTYGGRSMMVSTSIGGAVFPDDAGNFADLINAADIACYEVKTSGRRGFQRYTREMEDRNQTLVQMENDLSAALAEGQLKVDYIPQWNVQSQTLVGVEAQPHWEHPEHGLLDVHTFLESAKRSGLVAEIDLFVLKKALKQASEYASAGRTTHMAIKLCTPHMHADYLQAVSDLISEYKDMATCPVTLELPESLWMDQDEKIQESISALQGLGAQLTIDRFGANQSAISRLTDLSVNTLKIDHSLTAGLANNSNSRIIVSTMIKLAHSLGMTVVAERIDNDQQLDFLRNEGCDVVQGAVVDQAIADRA